MKDLLVQQDIYVTGRGTVLILSLEENKLKIGDLKRGEIISYENKFYTILKMESMKKLFGTEVFQDKIGLIVKVINEG